MSPSLPRDDIRRARFLREPVVVVNGSYRHWVEALADWLYDRLVSREKEEYVFNGGLSVSGLQHVGRLRGEIIIPDVVAYLLERKGLRVKRMLTLYTQDAWKGKESQLRVFPSPEEGEKYRGWPLIRVPDPYGCHENWVAHFWADFGPYIEYFTRGRVEVVTTTDLYRGRLRDFIEMVMERREEVRRLINKYRGRKPYPEGWIPFEPVCGKCGRIDKTRALSYNPEKKAVEYVCENCGWRGETSIENGKLNWRIEWVGVWWALGVDFEPYGKDHAAPGGSRDSANELAKLLGVEPPEGLPYEWVALRSGGVESDMSSSDFIGFTPREWLEVAHAEILRFLVLRTPPMRRLSLSLADVPSYYQVYYKAERVYYGVETTGREKDDVLLRRSYEYSYVRGEPPEKMPSQPPYTHIAILVQILPRELWFSEGLKRLQKTGHLPLEPTDFEVKRARTLFEKAAKWVEKYAPEAYRFTLLEKPFVDGEVEEYREELAGLAALLEKLPEWREDTIKEVLIEYTRGWSREKRAGFYRAFYKVFFGKPEGPRAAPLLSLMEPGFVATRLRLEEAKR